MEIQIKIVEQRGAVIYSDIKVTKLHCANAFAKEYPTITENKVTVENTNVTSPILSIKLVTANGQLLQQVRMPANISSINLSAYSAGRYALVVERKTQSQSIMVSKY